MSEPVSFSERLRAWRQRKEAHAAVMPGATASSADWTGVNMLRHRPNSSS